MKKAVLWHVTPCESCKNRRFGRTIATIIRVTRIGELGTLVVSVLQLLVTVNLSTAPILVMMETIRSSETSVLTRVTRRHIPEDGILHSNREG
jgi:hypothetical protein